METLDKELRLKFLDQLNICWLYCPDDVIKKAYEFLDTIQANKIQNDATKENALGEFILAIRKDLLSRKLVTRTELLPSEFRHLGAK